MADVPAAMAVGVVSGGVGRGGAVVGRVLRAPVGSPPITTIGGAMYRADDGTDRSAGGAFGAPRSLGAGRGGIAREASDVQEFVVLGPCGRRWRCSPVWGGRDRRPQFCLLVRGGGATGECSGDAFLD